jgi:deoxyribose-phosphate aldolase
MEITVKDLAKMIDHSLLHPTMTDEDIHSGCMLARKYDVATACVKPYAVQMAKEALAGSDVGVCAVIGFPHGNSTSVIKVAETNQAIIDGASEIDMVINIGKALSGRLAICLGRDQSHQRCLCGPGRAAEGDFRDRLS